MSVYSEHPAPAGGTALTATPVTPAATPTPAAPAPSVAEVWDGRVTVSHHDAGAPEVEGQHYNGVGMVEIVTADTPHSQWHESMRRSPGRQL